MGYKINYSDDFLAHYGVIGMKWGKHKRPEDAKRAAEDAKRAAEYEKNRNNTNTRKHLESERIKYSRDIGRAETNLGTTKINYGYNTDEHNKELEETAEKHGIPYKRYDPVTTQLTYGWYNIGHAVPWSYSDEMDNYFNAYTYGKIKTNEISSKIKKYDAKTKANVDKIKNGSTTLSQITTNASAKVKSFVNAICSGKRR